MKTNTTVPNDKGFRFPSEIISHAVWWSFRFSLRSRDVQELLAERGIVVSYETVRQWCLKFGQTYAHERHRRRPRCGDKWHMHEVVLAIRGKKHSLCRAVDQDGNVLDILVQSQRNKKAAKKFFRKRLKGLEYVPRVIITDKLKRDEAATRELLPAVEHPGTDGSRSDSTIVQRPLINRRGCVRRKCGIKSAGHAQRFLSAFDLIAGHFQPRRHRLSAQEYRAT